MLGQRTQSNMPLTESRLSFVAFFAVLAIVVLRGGDLWANGTYLENHPRYWATYYFEVAIVISGLLLLMLYEVESSYRHWGGLLFAALVSITTILDPDLPHFLRDPVIFLTTDLVFTVLLLIGTPLLGLLLYVTLSGIRRTGNWRQIQA